MSKIIFLITFSLFFFQYSSLKSQSLWTFEQSQLKERLSTNYDHLKVFESILSDLLFEKEVGFLDLKLFLNSQDELVEFRGSKDTTFQLHLIEILDVVEYCRAEWKQKLMADRKLAEEKSK